MEPGGWNPLTYTIKKIRLEDYVPSFPELLSEKYV